MPHYRAYLLDKTGRVSGPPYQLVCDNDDDAIERARRLVGPQPFALWNLDRLVIRFEGRGARADPAG
jgi:hypothetical protein